jgi:uncharacterized RDD family membrane protein YckC
MQLFNPRETARLKELEGVKLASFPRRSLAFLIDLIISVLLSSVLLLGYEYVNGKFNSNSDIKIDFNFENWYSIVATVIYFGLTTYFGNGKTLGKKLLKIRVVSITHTKMTFWQSIERALGYGASILEFGRTAHDRIAETIVVDES